MIVWAVLVAGAVFAVWFCRPRQVPSINWRAEIIKQFDNLPEPVVYDVKPPPTPSILKTRIETVLFWTCIIVIFVFAIYFSYASHGGSYLYPSN